MATALALTVVGFVDAGENVDERNLEIAARHIEVEKEPFAKGGFSKVYRAKWRDEEVVVKAITQGDEELSQKVKHEARITISLRHENVIKLHGFTTVKNGKRGIVGIVMELAAHGSLDKWIGKLDQDRTTKIALGIVDGLEYVHSQKVIHRDIKPNNILMCGLKDDMIPKIADFGVAKVIKTAPETHTRVGQDMYMAPEVKMFNHYSFPADIYSLAMTLFEVFSEQLMRRSSEDITRFITRACYGKVGDIPRSCKVPQCLQSIILRGWDEMPQDRPQLVEYRSALEGAYLIGYTAMLPNCALSFCILSFSFGVV